MAVALPSRTPLPAVAAIRTTIAARLQAAQAEAAAKFAAQRASVPLPPAPTPAQRAAQAVATVQAARTAGTAAAAQVRAEGGTSAQATAAALQAGVKAASQAVVTQTQARTEAVQNQIAAAEQKSDSMWSGAPWYADWKQYSKGAAPFKSIGFFNWMLGQVKKNGAGYFPEPPTDGVPFSNDRAHENWWEIMIRVFGGDKYPPPPPGSSLIPEWKDAYARATHPGGTFGEIARVLTAPVKFVARNAKQFGNILITLFGAVLAPFTGGASVLAATLVVGANQVRVAAVNAASASRTNSRAAAAQQAEAARQAAELEQKVNAFYRNNQAWFEQHGVTPDAWAKLTLDQKVELIRAGAAGQVPVTPSSNPIQGAMQAQSAPTRIPTTQGPMGPTSTSSSSPNVSGSFQLAVEGRPVATATSSQEISGDAQTMTSIGDRFEVFQNGQSLGLKVRTADGVISIPPDKADQVRSMSHADVLKLLGTASESAGASGGSGGGLLLLLALPAVAFVATKK